LKTYFVLRGGNEHLAEGELKALLEVYSPHESLECYTMICSSTAGLDVAAKIMRRAGFIKESGLLLGVYSAYSLTGAKEVAEVVGDRVIHLSVYKSTVSSRAVKEFLDAVGLKQGTRIGEEKRLIFSSGLVFVGIKKYVQSRKSMLIRTRNMPFKRSIALTPDIARVLINLSRAREGEVLLDPFAGTGVILVEAWSMGVRGIGVDLDWKLVKGMSFNVEYFKSNSIVIIGDSRYLSYEAVDHVATDLPYGKGASTHGTEIKQLYSSFVERLSEYLSKNGYACFMAPLWLEDYVDEIISTHGLKLAGRYYDYVHSALTRVINVVKW